MRVKVRFAHWIPRALRVEGIVLYPYILFRAPMAHVAPNIFQHEFIHVRQVRARGFLRFYASYAGEYIRGLFRLRSHAAAYQNISFEKEAYGAQGSARLSVAEEAEIGLTVAYGPHGKRAVVKTREGEARRA